MRIIPRWSEEVFRLRAYDRMPGLMPVRVRVFPDVVREIVANGLRRSP